MSRYLSHLTFAADTTDQINIIIDSLAIEDIFKSATLEHNIIPDYKTLKLGGAKTWALVLATFKSKGNWHLTNANNASKVSLPHARKADLKVEFSSLIIEA